MSTPSLSSPSNSNTSSSSGSTSFSSVITNSIDNFNNKFTNNNNNNSSPTTLTSNATKASITTTVKLNKNNSICCLSDQITKSTGTEALSLAVLSPAPSAATSSSVTNNSSLLKNLDSTILNSQIKGTIVSTTSSLSKITSSISSSILSGNFLKPNIDCNYNYTTTTFVLKSNNCNNNNKIIDSSGDGCSNNKSISIKNIINNCNTNNILNLNSDKHNRKNNHCNNKIYSSSSEYTVSNSVLEIFKSSNNSNSSNSSINTNISNSSSYGIHKHNKNRNYIKQKTNFIEKKHITIKNSLPMQVPIDDIVDAAAVNLIDITQTATASNSHLSLLKATTSTDLSTGSIQVTSVIDKDSKEIGLPTPPPSINSPEICLFQKSSNNTCHNSNINNNNINKNNNKNNSNIVKPQPNLLRDNISSQASSKQTRLHQNNNSLNRTLSTSPTTSIISTHRNSSNSSTNFTILGTLISKNNSNNKICISSLKQQVLTSNNIEIDDQLLEDNSLPTNSQQLLPISNKNIASKRSTTSSSSSENQLLSETVDLFDDIGSSSEGILNNSHQRLFDNKVDKVDKYIKLNDSDTSCNINITNGSNGVSRTGSSGSSSIFNGASNLNTGNGNSGAISSNAGSPLLNTNSLGSNCSTHSNISNHSISNSSPNNAICKYRNNNSNLNSSLIINSSNLNSNTSTTSIFGTEIDDTITEQIYLKEDSTGSFIENQNCVKKIKPEDGSPFSETGIQLIMSEENIKKELSSSALSPVVGSTNSGLLNTNSSNGSLNDRNTPTGIRSDSNVNNEIMTIKEEIIENCAAGKSVTVTSSDGSGISTTGNITSSICNSIINSMSSIKKEESDLSPDGFTPLCTPLTSRGSVGGNNSETNMQVLLSSNSLINSANLQTMSMNNNNNNNNSNNNKNNNKNSNNSHNNNGGSNFLNTNSSVRITGQPSSECLQTSILNTTATSSGLGGPLSGNIHSNNKISNINSSNSNSNNSNTGSNNNNGSNLILNINSSSNNNTSNTNNNSTNKTTSPKNNVNQITNNTGNNININNNTNNTNNHNNNSNSNVNITNNSNSTHINNNNSNTSNNSSGGNNSNHGSGCNSNGKQSVGGNNTSLSNLDFTQQQNHIFVFSTQLANKGAESVLNGQFPTIIAYHCSQPSTKKFFEDFFLKNPMKFSKMHRQNSASSQWIQQQQLHGSNKLIQNKNNNNINTNSNNLVLSSINAISTNNSNAALNNINNSNSINNCQNSNNNNNGNPNNSNSTSNNSNSNIANNSPNQIRSINIKNSTGQNAVSISSQQQNPSIAGSTNRGFSGEDMSMENDNDVISWEHQGNNTLPLDSLTNGNKIETNNTTLDNNMTPITSNNNSPTNQPTHSTNRNTTNSNRNQSVNITNQSISTCNSQNSPSANPLHGSITINTGSTSPNMSNLQPSLQGVKVPDENLTPQQRQHREEQLAKLKKMNQFLFPEHTGGGSDFIAGGSGTGPTPMATDQQIDSNVSSSVNKLIGQITTVGGSIQTGGSASSISPGSSLGIHGHANTSQISVSGSGSSLMNQSPGLLLSNGNIAGVPCNPLGPSNLRNNILGGLNSGRLATSGSLCRPMLGGGNLPSENMMDTTNSGSMNDFNLIVGNQAGSSLGQGNGSPNMMGHGGPLNIGSSGPNATQCGSMSVTGGLVLAGQNKNIPSGMIGHTGVAQLEWNKLQHQYYEERTKGKGNVNQILDNIALAGICNSSQNLNGGVSVIGRQISTINQNISLCNSNNTAVGSAVSRGNVTNCSRSQGPPPPYHQTPRSASVPIATQSPNPGSPNNPTSNLSLPSPRTAGGGGGINSPASDTVASNGNCNNPTASKSQIFKQDSPAVVNNNNSSGLSINLPSVGGSNNRTSIKHSSNPSTPISSHLSPNASLKDLELGIASTSNQEKSRLNTSGPSPQGARTPSLSGDHSNPASIDSRFLSASPNIIFSSANAAQTQQSTTASNQQSNSGGHNVNGNHQQQPGKINSGNFIDVNTIKTPTSDSSSANFCLRADNMPLNPNSSCPTPVKTSHFDPISSLAQMSQQLTNSVAGSLNGGSTQSQGGIIVGPGGYPNHMNMTDISSIGQPHGSDSMIGSTGLDICNSMSLTGLSSGAGGIGSNNQYMMHGSSSGVPNGMGGLGAMVGARSLSPKLGGMIGFQGNPMGMSTSHRMLGRPSIGLGGPGNLYNGANIQVKASTPNTIQYLPARPQVGNQNPRAPPSLDFLPRFVNPPSTNSGVDNGPPIKISASGSGSNMSYYSNCNQMGVGSNNNLLVTSMNPHLDNSGSEGSSSGGIMGIGNSSPTIGNSNIGNNGPNSSGNNSLCASMGQNMLMRGLRPPAQSSVLRMPSSVGASHCLSGPNVGNPLGHHHMFNGPSGPPNNQSAGQNNLNDSSMFASQMFGGSSGAVSKSNILGLGGLNGSQMSVPGGSGGPMCAESGQGIPPLGSGPGGMIGMMVNQVGPVSTQGSVGFKSQSQFVGPSTTDPNYAQQYHNFQQQLYATSTRSQAGNNAQNGINNNGNSGNSNQPFFVPK